MSTLVSSDYRVIESATIADLTKEVNAALKAGYQLRGGVSLAYVADTRMLWYAQALVLEMWISDGND